MATRGAPSLKMWGLEVCFPMLATCELSDRTFWTQGQSEELRPKNTWRVLITVEVIEILLVTLTGNDPC